MDSNVKKFKVTGMSCAACSARVEKAVGSLGGVEECSVNLLLGTMQVKGGASVSDIISAVKAAGYGASEESGASAEENSARGGDWRDTTLRAFILRLVISSVLLLVLMYFSMGHTMLSLPLPGFLANDLFLAALCQMLLALAIMLINAHFFIGGAKGIIKLSPNMDTLVALGSGASFVYSTVLMLMMLGSGADEAMALYHGLYFESAAMILVLIGIGKMLEHIAKGRTTSAIRALMDLTPKTARVKRGEEWVEIPAREIAVGDVFLVKRGENIVSDGVLVGGECSVDESALTGESIPCDKHSGLHVYGGTTLLSGYAEIKATEVGEGTVISGIVRTVREAAGSKAPIAKIADKVAGVFVPVVIAIAVIATVIWLIAEEEIGFALARGVCVLVISCPCALGLATPVAIMVGSGVGARYGVLFKTAAALEHTASVKVVAFDKTGTITEGRPTVDELIPIGISERELLDFVYTLERSSEHPLASAVVSYAGQRGADKTLSASNFAEGRGGVSVLIGGEHIYGGNIDYIKDSGAEVNADISDRHERLSSLGKTVLLFAKEREVVGIAAISDKVKADSRAAIEELHRMGIRSVMISGDNERCAKSIAKEVGIDEVIAGVFPEEKADEIKRLRAASGAVAMVGDGVNDAPALTVADVGIAIGRGTDIAIDSADIVLVGNTLAAVPEAIRLSRRVLGKIKQNLFWAFCYNIVGIPLAAGAFIPLFGWSLSPMFGAAAMSVSSFLVVTNALLLNLYRPTLLKGVAISENPSLAEDKKNNSESNKGEKQMTVTLKIEGMMCPHCSGRVKSALEAIGGVESASVSHESGEAVVLLGRELDEKLLIAAVENSGYKVV